MRFEATTREEVFCVTSIKLVELCKEVNILVQSLLFEAICFECNRMSAVPQSAFAVCQIRKNLERKQQQFIFAEKYPEEEESKNFGAKILQEGREPTPLKYNSKLMNSIWGLYNRYSVHNFKKIDANETGLLAWGGLHPEAGAGSDGPTAGIIRAGH